jgi:hypothetical protein
MKKTFLTLAAVAALGFSGAAFAEEGNTGPAPMTDAEMDSVTAAGGATVLTPGPGVDVTLPGHASPTAVDVPNANINADDNPATHIGAP